MAHSYWTSGSLPPERWLKVLRIIHYEMDYETHRENSEAIYEEECYISYDKESGQTYYYQTFDEWYEPPQEIVPVQLEVSGEINVYRVILSLNELGQSFLKIADYIYEDELFEYRSFTVDEV